MTAVRQDAWTDDDDLMLAETTLRHIRDGSTQLNAFEEVGEKIGRTAAACGFRWNSCVRKKYEAAIQIAKAQRQKRGLSKKVAIPEVTVSGQESTVLSSRNEITEAGLSVDAVIRFLRQWKTTYQEMSRQIKQLEKEVKEKDELLDRIRNEKERLEKEVNVVQTDYRVVNDDYRALIQIMDRARKMAFLVEEDEESKARFKMDANGNLERID
jgi:prespore-specific regulator